MSVSAKQVKELRERTGAGMMECKKALLSANGKIEDAVEELRKRGQARAGKKADRVATEGAIIILSNDISTVMLEINCETDFVARDKSFVEFANAVAEIVLTNIEIQDVTALLSHPNKSGEVVDELRKALVAKLGENITIRRFIRSNIPTTQTGIYLHGSRIGVVVELDKDLAELAKDIAMHVAASKPLVIMPEDVPVEIVNKEREIFTAQAATSGKPQQIIEKIVEGRVRKFLDETCLRGQPFVKNPEMTVGELLDKNHTTALNFYRFEVGEGVEKETENFVDAVMAQVRGE